MKHFSEECFKNVSFVSYYTYLQCLNIFMFIKKDEMFIKYLYYKYLH